MIVPARLLPGWSRRRRRASLGPGAGVDSGHAHLPAAPDAEAMTDWGMIHGRFQPFHNGHLEYLLAAAARCDRLLVGITNPDRLRTRPEPEDPVRHLPESNPFTYTERLLMTEAAAGAAGLEITVIPFPMDRPGDVVGVRAAGDGAVRPAVLGVGRRQAGALPGPRVRGCRARGGPEAGLWPAGARRHACRLSIRREASPIAVRVSRCRSLDISHPARGRSHPADQLRREAVSRILKTNGSTVRARARRRFAIRPRSRQRRATRSPGEADGRRSTPEQLGNRPSALLLYQGYPFDRLRRRLGLELDHTTTVDPNDVSCASPEELDDSTTTALDDARLVETIASAVGLRDDAQPPAWPPSW